MMDMKTLALGSGLFGATTTYVNQLSTDHLGVSLGVIAFAFAGSALSYSWDADGLPDIPKTQMYRRVAVTTFVTTAMVALLPGWMGWEWDKTLEIPLAMIMSSSARFVIPAFINLVPAILRKWFKLDPADNDKTEEVNWEAPAEEEPPPKTRRKKT